MVNLIGLGIFFGAALLFVVEPMVGRLTLPIFGGTALVWTSLLAFFQTVLLAGYGYVYWAERRLSARGALVVHALVLMVPLLALPLHLPPAAWADDWGPAPKLLALVSLMVGLPFFTLCATGPCLQRVLTMTRPSRAVGDDPYFLYVASNAGSLLGLLAYPLLVEPWLTLHAQTTLWSWGYATFVALMLVILASAWRRLPADTGPLQLVVPAPSTLDTPVWPERLRWIGLAALASGLLASISTAVTTDLMAVPFWWVVPLTLYLISLMLAFANPPRWPAHWTVPMLTVVLPLWVGLIAMDVGVLLLVVALVGFFLALMLAHGSLAAARPVATRLGEFYVCLACGGAVGSLCCALAPPLLFDRVVEYPLTILGVTWLLNRHAGYPRALVRNSLLAGCFVALFGMFLKNSDQITAPQAQVCVLAATLVIGLVWHRKNVRHAIMTYTIALLAVLIIEGGGGQRTLYRARSFFGAYRVITTGDTNEFVAELNGTTLHGLQSADPGASRVPLSYYTHEGPAGRVLDKLPSDPNHPIGAVGLGVGALACYGTTDDPLVYFELDPLVEAVARDSRFFTYLRDCPAKVVTGDARLRLQTYQGPRFRALVLDAYGSDAIPVHLLTREALALYLDVLDPNGLLLFHVTNRHYHIDAVVGRILADAQLSIALGYDTSVSVEANKRGHYVSEWILAARRPELIAPYLALPLWQAWKPDMETPLWTDDHASVVRVLTGH